MTAYDLKEDFFGIYDDHPSSREEAEAAFDAWIREIPDGREFDPFRALARTVQNHREFIFNYWECPSRISNGYTECANRLINETDMRGARLLVRDASGKDPLPQTEPRWTGNGVLDRFLEDESLFGEFLRTPVSEGGVESLVVEPPHIVVEVGA